MYLPLFPTNLLGKMANYIIHYGARKVIKYMTEKEVIKATRKLSKGKVDNRSRKVEICFTMGTPNFEEREFIKKLKKAGEPFPVKKFQIKFIKPAK